MEEHESELVDIQDLLQRYAISLTHDIENANDLLQDTSLRILSKLDTYEEKGCFEAWAKTIMKRTFLNNAKKISKKSETIVDGYDFVENDADHPLVADSESLLIGKELRDTIKLLPPKYAEMIVMRINGFKYEEIANKMELSVGCVKSTIFSARSNLRNIIKN